MLLDRKATRADESKCDFINTPPIHIHAVSNYHQLVSIGQLYINELVASQ